MEAGVNSEMAYYASILFNCKAAVLPAVRAWRLQGLAKEFFTQP